jgi:hypothetical protein
VHRREAALVVVCVPGRQSMTAMGGAERVVDVEALLLARPRRRAGLIDESCCGPRRLGPARRILQTTDRRLRDQWRAACRTAADRDLHKWWIMPKPVEVDGILVAAGALG